jgi:hypothetical protein
LSELTEADSRTHLRQTAKFALCHIRTQ